MDESSFAPASHKATEHRCKAGGWRPGPAASCRECHPKQPYKSKQFIRVK